MSSVPIIEAHSPLMSILCNEEFEQLTPKEKLYAYHFYQASWEGSKINYFQKSFEAPALFTIIQLVFSNGTEGLKASCLANGMTEAEWTQITVYCAAVLNNCGNFKSFGDTKFVPEFKPETFELLIKSSASNAIYSDLLNKLWATIKSSVYNHEGSEQKIGFPDKGGFSGYYSSNLKSDEIELIDEFLAIKNLSPLNTRVIKRTAEDFLVLVASANLSKVKTFYYKTKKISIQYGDFSNMLRKVSQNLQKAIPHAANPNQEKMLKAYVEHFNTGKIDLHKDSQRHWVADKGPVVETNIGFIETYLDPLQVRAEWEGFVAMVNKKLSERIGCLVSLAGQLLSDMPWPRDFEKDVFLKPDFTSLAVLAFGSSGTPLGINIPNYDDIRQNEGFKNVYLGNCLPSIKQINYVNEKDSETYLKFAKQMIFIKVSCHELLGHGCGKLFVEDDKGFNFDKENLKNPLTGGPITSWYRANETWNGKFGSLNNPYEECRADSVALFFSCSKEVTKILAPENLDDFDEIMAAQWVDFVLAGVQALEFYIPEKGVWGQAHMRGRFVILSVLREAGNGFVKIEKTKNSEGKDWIAIHVDRSQILTTGLTAIKNFLVKLQVYKSTADIENGKKMFDAYSEVDEYFLDIRKIVLANKKPRRIELQGHLKKTGNTVEYVTFPESFEGVIQSYMARYPYFDADLVTLWEEYREFYAQK